MREKSAIGKIIDALKLAKIAGVGVELSLFEAIELLGEIESLKEYIRDLETEAVEWQPYPERLPEYKGFAWLMYRNKEMAVFELRGNCEPLDLNKYDELIAFYLIPSPPSWAWERVDEAQALEQSDDAEEVW